MVQRFLEQINGANGPNTPEWEGHQTAIKESQTSLRKLLNKWIDDGCGGDSPKKAQNAWHWATKPVPSDKEWVNPNSEMIQNGAKVALGAGIVYGAYRVIRLLPSLYPPLWWTIGPNLATP